MTSFHEGIENLNQQIKTLNIQPIVENSREKLDQWRMECHRKIDQIFERKIHDIHRFIDEKIDDQRSEIRRLQSKLDQFTYQDEIDKQDFDSIQSIIDDIQMEIDYIKELYRHISTHAFELDDNIIHINNQNIDKFNVSTLSTIYKGINHPQGSYGTLACNEKFLLVHLAPNFILFDKHINIIEQIPWRYGTIKSMCWSSAIGRFFIIEESHIFLINDQTMSVERLKLFEKRRWLSCTCSEKSLFLSVDETNPSIVEFSLLPSIKFVKEWKSPQTCRKQERIDNIVYNKSTLALIISNRIEKSVRMELRCSKTLEHIWTLQLDIVRNQKQVFHCCSLNVNKWLIADYQNQCLIYITNDGSIKEVIPYNSIPYHAVSFGSHMLAISRKNGIHFHRL